MCESDILNSRYICKASDTDFKELFPKGGRKACSHALMINTSVAAVFEELRAAKPIVYRGVPHFDDVGKVNDRETNVELAARRLKRTKGIFSGLSNGTWFFTVKKSKNLWGFSCSTEAEMAIAVLLYEAFLEWAKRVQKESGMGKYELNVTTGVMMKVVEVDVHGALYII